MIDIRAQSTCQHDLSSSMTVTDLQMHLNMNLSFILNLVAPFLLIVGLPTQKAAEVIKHNTFPFP